MPLFVKLYQHRVLRFLVAGGIGAAVNLGLLYFLTDIVGWWYIFAATITYPLSFFVSFALQKYWTFTDNSSDNTHRQALIYLVVVVINIFINNSILLVLTERFGFHYLISQVFASLIVATWSYFIYRWLFRGKEVEPEKEKV